ncbi:MAG TPA: cytochrome c biogenesis protein ResB [Blastocatellia bacterium]|nr:cytochrome c biogenesis protein ResB [Blastocatellia bacterium]
MSTSEPGLSVEAQASAKAEPQVKAVSKKSDSVLDKVLGLLSSVRFGVTMLSILLVCCVIGMLIMQVEVEGFQEYYQSLTPAQRLIYGKLDFFQIYHSWYFNLLLAITGLNIILASIDRFPTAWQYIVKPRLKASPNFIRAQMFNREAEYQSSPDDLAGRVQESWRKRGFRSRVSQENNRITVFAQRNVWNRLGAYVVHIGLLTIFIGGFLTSRYGVGGMMEIRPGRVSNAFSTFEMAVDGQKQGQALLPFEVECTDLQQKLIRPEGFLDANNTIDWLSYIKVRDQGQEVDALVHLNNPFDYKGYRFFQSQFTPIGNARTITIEFQPASGGQGQRVTIPRDGSVDVPGIGVVSYVGFYPDFKITEAGPRTVAAEYNNPVAQLEVTGADGKRRTAFGFNPKLGEELLAKPDAAIDKETGENMLLVAGNKVILRDYEKVATAHTLAVQYDPGRLPVYIGFTVLCIALCLVFFFSHQRVWAVIEPSATGSRIFFGGNTNRNRPAFEGRFNSLVEAVIGGRDR